MERIIRKEQIAVMLIIFMGPAGCGSALQTTHQPLSMGEGDKPEELLRVPFYSKP